ncbi:hypothetical protein BKA66DRAFT_460639 [Pyrenochaeta sp. MPI-SDFR-AT-0127]|nr:hypothetical protein BKA66DRAFT_460639 [Pyrenochaeta sp. MPI-SDFR-AT-0127]
MFQQPFAQTEHGRHSPVRNQSPMEEPLDMVCETCGTKTTGVYCKTNMNRHIRLKHPLSGSIMLTPCRACSATFRRSDAARKHEWKKHRILDARPNKRRK